MRYLDQLKADPRVDEISDERDGDPDGGDGIWVYLKRGWCNGEDCASGHYEVRCVHSVHEWKVADVRAAMPSVTACDCNMCAEHYGDSGLCDQGKPVASPHRKGCKS